VTAFLFLITYLIQQPHILFDYLFYLKSIILISALVVVFVIDLEHFLILDKVLVAFGLPLLVLNLTLDKLDHQALFSLISLTTGGLFSAFVFSSAFFLLWLVSKGLWIGLGDVKLMLFLGIALGWPNTLICWFLAFVLGTIYALPLLVLGKKKLTSKVPFGVFLSLSALICLYAGRSILGWYLSFLGF
jgi:prepilin signal peptidase PulO-like enzyme (type II secretory pathway)